MDIVHGTPRSSVSMAEDRDPPLTPFSPTPAYAIQRLTVTGQQVPPSHDPGAAAMGADYPTSGPCDRPLWAPRYAPPPGQVPRLHAAPA